MMTFIEEFPSFHEEDDYNWEMLLSRDLDIFIKQKDVERFCLDKQRVKEVIENLVEEYYRYGVPSGEEPCIILNRILKELRI